MNLHVGLRPGQEAQVRSSAEPAEKKWGSDDVRTQKICVPPTSKGFGGRVIEVSTQHLDSVEEDRRGSSLAQKMLEVQTPCEAFFSQLQAQHRASVEAIARHGIQKGNREVAVDEAGAQAGLYVLVSSVAVTDIKLVHILRQPGPISGKILAYLEEPLRTGMGIEVFKGRYEALANNYARFGLSESQWTNIQQRLVLQMHHNPRILENIEYLALMDVRMEDISPKAMFADFLSKNPSASLKQIGSQIESLRMGALLTPAEFEDLMDEISLSPSYQKASPSERKEFWNHQLLSGVSMGVTSEVVEYLLHHGADIQAKDDQGNSVLHCLLNNPQRPHGPDYTLLYLLRHKKLSIQSVNGDHVRPIDLAIRSKREPDVEMILRELAGRHSMSSPCSLHELFLSGIGYRQEGLSPLTSYNNAMYFREHSHIFESMGFSLHDILKQLWEVPLSA